MQSKHLSSLCITIFFCCLLSSCSSIITNRFIQPAVGNLQQQTDIELVCEGAPAYLLMLDSMLISSPEDTNLLLTVTQSYSAYSSALKECGDGNMNRIPAIAEKAKLYGQSLLRAHLPLNASSEELTSHLEQQRVNDVPELFWGTLGWLTWVQSQNGSPASIADIVQIEMIMNRIAELDPSYQGGSVHVFFGSYHAAKPVMFGGKPEVSRQHFEKALELSERRFLLTQTTYAETLARATFDQELHDRLLREVLDFPLDSAPEFGLSNRIAQKRAKKLLDENYFGE